MLAVRSKPARTTTITDVEGPTDHPLPRFPAELLAKIFTYTVQDQYWPALDISRGPWVLTYVNRFWRTVALRMPELWSRLHVRLGKQSASSQFLCELLLQNSGSHPLELTISSSFQFYSHPIFDLLLSTASNRWKVAILRLPVGLIMQSMSLYASQFSQLETLDLDFSHMDFETEDSDQVPRVNAFALAPKLRDVRIQDTSFYAELSLPWKQLKSFFGDISYFNADSYQSLWSATNLIELQLSLTFAYQSRQHATFSFLRKMCIVVDVGCDIGCLFDYGTFPALEVLDIIMISANYRELRNADEFNMESVVEMVKRSACQLTHLSIGKNGMIQEDIIPLLELTSRLVKLKITRPSPDVIRAMTWSEENELLPQLEFLTVEGVPSDKDLFTDMVLSRMNCATQKKCLHTLFMALPYGTLCDRNRLVHEMLQSGVNALPRFIVCDEHIY